MSLIASLCILIPVAASASSATSASSAASASSATSASSAADATQKVVRVGYYEDNDGFQLGFSDDERKSGYAYEYYQEIAKYAGWRYEYAYGSWGEMYDALLAGDIDIMAGVSKTDERQGKMLFPDAPMGTESYYIFVPTDYTGISSGDPTTLDGKRIGVNENSLMLTLFQEYVADHGLDCQIKTYDGHASCAEALKNGDIDGYVITDNYVVEGVKPVIKIGASDIYFAIANGREDLLSDINYAQEQILAASPYYATSLQSKYFNRSIMREALNDTELTWLSAHGSLSIGYVDGQMPFSATGDDGSSTGLVRTLQDETSKFLGVPVNTVAFSSIDGLIAALKAGTVDAAFPIYGDIWTAEQRGIYLTNQVASSQMVVVYKGTYDSTYLQTIGVSDDIIGQTPYLAQYYPDAKTFHFGDMQECINALQAGKVRSIIMDSSIFQRYLSEHEQAVDLHFAYLDNPIVFSMAVSEDGSVLQSILNKCIAHIGDSKINDAITRNTYAAIGYSFSSFIKHNVVFFVVMLACLLAMLALIFVLYRRKSIEHQRQLADANRAKSEFLSRMSHDIRTPMNAIVNLTTMARDEMDDRDKLESDLKKITISSEFLLGLINDILDMSRIENGKLTLSPSVYRADELGSYLESVIEPLCSQKDITLECSQNDVSCDFLVDRTRFNQVFFNIFSNAVKYTGEGGHISFSTQNVQVGDGRFSCDYVIADTGCGMSEEFMTHLFQPFERENYTEAFAGTGLGLTITKSIIDTMGGTIAISSTPDVGTTVRVHLDLPLATPEQSAEYTAQLQEKDSDAHKPDDGGSDALVGKRVLIAEDHPLNQEIVKRLVMKFGLVPDCVDNGKLCVERFTASEDGYYDLILMDIRMPIEDGLQAAHEIRALQRKDATAIPIVAVSADAFAGDEQASREAGMDAHISKPIDPDELLRVLHELLG